MTYHPPTRDHFIYERRDAAARNEERARQSVVVADHQLRDALALTHDRAARERIARQLDALRLVLEPLPEGTA